jgi:hypothetical protein
MDNYIDERRKQDQDELIDKIIDAIIGVGLVVAIAIIFWPKEVDAAEYPQIGYSKLADTKPVIQEVSYDDQKTLDLWKHNPKIEYTIKSLTLQQTIWRYLTDDMGLSDVCAAGIFGNMMVECGSRSFNLQPYIYSPGGFYYGLCQWNTGGHHASINGGTVEEQLEYLSDTIRNEMGSAGYSAFEGATDPESAAYYFARWYERCTDPSGRGNEARRAYERFGT